MNPICLAMRNKFLINKIKYSKLFYDKEVNGFIDFGMGLWCLVCSRHIESMLLAYSWYGVSIYDVRSKVVVSIEKIGSI